MNEFYLKVLSGNHLGAEIPLESGRHSLGLGDQCDLVFTDASLNEIEVVIDLSEDGLITVSSSNDELLYLNGMPQGNQVNPNPFDIITANNLYFALGPAEADWPELPLPQLQRPAAEDLPDPGSDNDFEDDEDDLGELPDFPDDILDDGASNEDEEDLDLDLGDEPPFDEIVELGDDLDDDEDEDEEFDNPLADISKKWLLAIPLILVAIFLIIILASSPSEPAPEELRAQLSYFEHGDEIKNLLKLKNIKLKELPDKSILVSGYTNTLNDKQTLLNELRERGVPFTSQVVVMSELRANADTLLKTKGYQSLSLELDTSPGSLVMTGYVGSSEGLSKIIGMLKQEIHGLVAIVDQVENQAGRLNTLKSMLREKGLSPRIHLIQKPNQVTLEGHLLDDEQVYNLNDVVTRFRKRYGNNPVLRLGIKSGGASSKTPEPKSAALSIRAVSMGRVPYVIMEDGAKYLIGAKLENGYIIEDINLDYLLLTKGTSRIKYRLGGNRGGQENQQ